MSTLFLVPLVLGFGLNAASAFTAAYSRRWGTARGQWVSAILRNVVGIPVWALGLALAVRSPARLLIARSPLLDGAGLLLLGAGLVPITLGIWTLRRRAAAPSMHDALEERGVYGLIRHPIYSGALLEFLGTALSRPTAPVLVACALGLGWAMLQARLEERDLLQRLPAYRAYMARVPRFVPRLWPRAKGTM